MEDRRQAPRVPFRCEVRCVDVETGTRTTNSRVNDISVTGLFLDTPVTFPKGSVVRLEFMLPSLQMKLTADVVYSIPAIGMGLRFRDVTPVHRVAIEELLESGALA